MVRLCRRVCLAASSGLGRNAQEILSISTEFSVPLGLGRLAFPGVSLPLGRVAPENP
jgi:hypothetical protein